MIVYHTLLSSSTAADISAFIESFFLKAFVSNKKVAHCKPKFERLHDTLLQFWKVSSTFSTFFAVFLLPKRKSFAKKDTLLHVSELVWTSGWQEVEREKNGWEDPVCKKIYNYTSLTKTQNWRIKESKSIIHVK